MFATASLTLAVLMLAAGKLLGPLPERADIIDKSRLTPLAPLGFGLVLFVVMMMSVAYTGGAIK